MAVYTEEVSLKDGISGPAQSAAKQLDVLQKALMSAQNKMTLASASGNAKGFTNAANEVKKLQNAIGQLPPELNKASVATDGWNATLTEMTGGLNLVVEYGAAAATVIGAIVIAGAAMAIKANEAKQKMVSLFDALGEGKVTGKATVAMLDQLGDQIGQTRDQLAPLTKEFLTMGVTSTEQLKALTLAAASAGAMAEGGAEAFTKLYKQASAAAETGSKFTVPYKKLDAQLTAMGLNIDDVGKAMGKTGAELTKGLKAGTVDAKEFANALQQAATNKGAGPLARAGASLTNVWAKFQENISKFFEDVDVGPFLLQVKDLFSIFESGQSSGRTLKAGIGGFFKQVFETATKLVPLVKHFLLDLIIFGLKAYISLKPTIAGVKEFLASAQGLQAQSALWSALKGAIIAVAVVIGVVVAALGVMAVATVAVGTFIWSSIEAFGEWVATLATWASSAVTAASDFIKGLVNGITSGASQVVDAVKNLANGAKDAFKNALGIHSPSKEMMKLGNFAGQGVAMGLDQSADQVGASSAGMAGSAKDGASSGLSSGGGGGTTITVNVEPGAIVIGGGTGGAQQGGQSAAELTETAVSLIFERVALAAGL